MDKLRSFKNFVNSVNETKSSVPEGLPGEVVKSSLGIVRGMYDKVKNPSFYTEGDYFFLKFTVTPTDFKYIDPNEMLPLDLSVGAMSRRDYYVELSYDDQYPSYSEVSYKIIFEPMTPGRYGKAEKNDQEFIDEYEEELRREREEDTGDIEDIDVL